MPCLRDLGCSDLTIPPHRVLFMLHGKTRAANCGPRDPAPGNLRDGSDGHHPPCGPRRLLCLGRADAGSVVARQARRGRRRGGARGVLRSQGLRGAQRNAGTEGARALSGAHFCQRPFQGLSAAGRCRHAGGGRLHAPGRADLHRRGLRRRRGDGASLRAAGRNRASDPAPRADGTGASDLGWRGTHQAPRENRLASGQARRAARCRSPDRARIPARSAGRADVGRGAGHQGAPGRHRRPHDRAVGQDLARARSNGCSAGRLRRSWARSPGIAIHGKSRRIGARNRRERSRRSARSRRPNASSGRRFVISPTGSAAACGPSRGSAAL